MHPEFIIIHHSATADGEKLSWQAIRRGHLAKRYRDIGYHYGIELINTRYEILTGRMLNESGAHCRGWNGQSIGICFIGNFERDRPPEGQIRLGLRLVESLREVFDIPEENVKPHRDFKATLCPGRFFPMYRFNRWIEG